MIFWIPPLLRATAWDSDPALEAKPALAGSDDRSPFAGDSSASMKPTVITLSVLPAAAWQTMSRPHGDSGQGPDAVQLSTAIFQSNSDTSRVGRIAYSDEPTSDVNSTLQAQTRGQCSTALAERPEEATLILSTTILGRTRRAAVINGRLCREGDQLLAGGETYRLTSVALDHVELVRDAGAAEHTHRVVRLTLRQQQVGH
jgi:hypothetical protein